MTLDHGKSVLVVDDDQDILDMIREMLSMEGHDVRIAHHGHEALGLIAGVRPDLILLDLEMPVMDGETFAMELHARYSPGPPIVVVSGMDEVRRRAIRLGAVDWLTKPFEFSALIETVARWVDVTAVAPLAAVGLSS